MCDAFYYVIFFDLPFLYFQHFQLFLLHNLSIFDDFVTYFATFFVQALNWLILFICLFESSLRSLIIFKRLLNSLSSILYFCLQLVMNWLLEESYHLTFLFLWFIIVYLLGFLHFLLSLFLELSYWKVFCWGHDAYYH
jgi:hypothetical protein